MTIRAVRASSVGMQTLCRKLPLRRGWRSEARCQRVLDPVLERRMKVRLRLSRSGLGWTG